MKFLIGCVTSSAVVLLIVAVFGSSGLAIDKKDRLYICDTYNQRVQILFNYLSVRIYSVGQLGDNCATCCKGVRSMNGYIAPTKVSYQPGKVTVGKML